MELFDRKIKAYNRIKAMIHRSLQAIREGTYDPNKPELYYSVGTKEVQRLIDVLNAIIGKKKIGG